MLLRTWIPDGILEELSSEFTTEEVGKNIRMLEMFGISGIKNLNTRHQHVRWLMVNDTMMLELKKSSNSS